MIILVVASPTNEGNVIIVFGALQRTRQRIERSRSIAEVLAKYGFDFVVEQLELSGPGRLWRSRRKEPEDLQPLSPYARLRHMMEELGPTFVKFGQTISTRADLLPPELIAELDKLQDEVPPFPFAVAREVIEKELGAPLDDLFLELEPEPFAAASIGQVHRGLLPDGTQVVVKVQRPDIERQMRADLLIMQDLANLAERRTDWGKRYAVQQLIEEFSYQLQEQLDYTVEGHHAENFRRSLEGTPHVYIPRVFWDYSTHRLLTTEYVEGIKIDHVESLDEAGFDREAIAAHFVEIMAVQALANGFYHADPHPGNLMVTADGDIVFMDFGMVGYLDEELKENLLDVVIGVVHNDIDGIVYTLLKIGIVRHRVDRAQLKADVRKVMRKYYEMPLSQVPFVDAMNEMLLLATKHNVRIPPDLTLLIKTALTVEGLATQLDPGMSIVDIARPFAQRIQRERTSPRYWAREVSRELMALRRLMSGLPGRLDDVLYLIESGDISIKFELSRLSAYLRDFGVIINRLTAGIVVAAMFIASSLSLGIAVGPMWFGLPALAVLGFFLSTLLGVWLFVAILRSGAL